MNTNAIDYHVWLCARLHGIIVKDKAKAETARTAGDLTLAKAHEKFASDAISALAFVESWDIASYNQILRKEAKHQFKN